MAPCPEGREGDWEVPSRHIEGRRTLTLGIHGAGGTASVLTHGKSTMLSCGKPGLLINLNGSRGDLYARMGPAPVPEKAGNKYTVPGIRV